MHSFLFFPTRRYLPPSAIHDTRLVRVLYSMCLRAASRHDATGQVSALSVMQDRVWDLRFARFTRLTTKQ